MNILQNNPYRMLGVFANTSVKERVASLNKMKAYLMVGKTISFPLDISQYLHSIDRTTDSVLDANSKLTLPIDQIHYAQFWFVKSTVEDEIAFNYLFSGNMDKAVEIWSKLDGVSSIQNRIVCELIKRNFQKALLCAEELYGNSDKIKEFITLILRNNTNIVSSKELVFYFLDKILDEMSADYMLKCISNSEWKNYIIDKVSKPLIDKIENAVSVSKHSLGQSASERLKSGKLLQKNTKSKLLYLKSLLSECNSKYQMIADKLATNILDCSIDYFNHAQDYDAPGNAFELASYAMSIAVGKLVKDRCKTNLDTIKQRIDNLPPAEIFSDYSSINQILQEYSQLPHIIYNAMPLLHKTKPYLESIRAKLGNRNEFYSYISTQVVITAMNFMIEDLNTTLNCSDIRLIKNTLKNATILLKLVDNFDMDENYRLEYYNISKARIEKLCGVNMASPILSYVAVLVLIALTIFVAYMLDNGGVSYFVYASVISILSFLYPSYERSNYDGWNFFEEVSSFGFISLIFILLFIPLVIHYWIYKGIKFLISIFF